MNYLQLCQHVNLYGGFQGAVSSVNASGYQALLVDAVKKAWVEIQKERPDWDFMYADVSFSLASGTTSYSPTVIFGTSTPEVGTWDRVVYDHSVLRFIPYKEFVLLEDSSPGKPSFYTIHPATQALVFNSLDGSYSVTAYYTKTPQLLVNNTDTPILPQKHHHIIVYKAVLELAAYVSSAEIYQQNRLNYDRAIGQLYRDHVPAKVMRVRPIA